mgnify:CR=1 FL=1
MTQWERSAKKRRLMTTPDWTGFKTAANVNSPLEGTRPFFATTKNYDSRGQEKKEEVKDGKPTAEPSFFSKYWMYILAALFVLPRLFEAPAGDAPAGGAPAAGGATR